MNGKEVAQFDQSDQQNEMSEQKGDSQSVQLGLQTMLRNHPLLALDPVDIIKPPIRTLIWI